MGEEKENQLREDQGLSETGWVNERCSERE